MSLIAWLWSEPLSVKDAVAALSGVCLHRLAMADSPADFATVSGVLKTAAAAPASGLDWVAAAKTFLNRVDELEAVGTLPIDEIGEHLVEGGGSVVEQKWLKWLIASRADIGDASLDSWRYLAALLSGNKRRADRCLESLWDVVPQRLIKSGNVARLSEFGVLCGEPFVSAHARELALAVHDPSLELEQKLSWLETWQSVLTPQALGQVLELAWPTVATNAVLNRHRVSVQRLSWLRQSARPPIDNLAVFTSQAVLSLLRSRPTIKAADVSLEIELLGQLVPEREAARLRRLVSAISVFKLDPPCVYRLAGIALGSPDVQEFNQLVVAELPALSLRNLKASIELPALLCERGTP